MAEYTTMVPSPPIAPGYSLFGVEIIPATPGETNNDFPKLPSLPKIPSFGDIQKGVDDTARKYLPGYGIAADTADAASTAFSILTDPVRVVTVIAGLIFLFGGLYILGTSQIADAFKGALK